MKNLFLISFLINSCFVFSQKFGYVDTDYILSQVPEYRAAQTELDKASSDWQKEIDAKYMELDKLTKAYQAEKIFLTEDMMKKREADIANREKEVRDLQSQKFGVEGELFKKRMELVKPIQDKVYNAVKAVAERGGFAILFDKSGSLTMLYTNPRHDKSEDVLNYMGYNKKK